MCEKTGKERGSQVNIQWSVNFNADAFKKSIIKLNPEWEGGIINFYSPLKESCYKEYSSLCSGKISKEAPSFWDSLDKECPEDIKNHSFWPTREAHWDALAVIKYGPNNEKKQLLLFEAKAHSQELCSSKKEDNWSESSRDKIVTSIKNVWSNIAPRKTITDWLRSYQFANRITYAMHLCDAGIPTCIIYVLYTNDYSFKDYMATKEDWNQKLEKEYAMMGIENISSLDEIYKVVFQEAPSAQELLSKCLISKDVTSKYYHKR